MCKVYLGSLNPVKIKAVEMVVNKPVIGVEVDSGVGVQPLSDEETIQGAYNRAKSIKEVGLRFGLEAGVQMLKTTMYLVNWGVLIDENNHEYFAGGTRIPLPNYIKDEVLKGEKELATIIDEYFQTQNIKHKEGAIGIFTANFVTRVDIFIHIVKLLYGQYIAKSVDNRR